MAANTGVKQILGTVLLAVLAQPIHEIGHAIALRALTGFWPRIGFLSVHPLVAIGSKASALRRSPFWRRVIWPVTAWWALTFVWA